MFDMKVFLCGVKHFLADFFYELGLAGVNWVLFILVDSCPLMSDLVQTRLEKD